MRRWNELSVRINGPDMRSLDAARAMAAEHANDTGVVVALRYAPRAAFGLAPHRDWIQIDVCVDGEAAFGAAMGGDGVEWIPLPAGEHTMSVVARRGSEMAACDVAIESNSVTVVSVLPKRHRGLLPGFIGGSIRPE